LVPGKIVVLDTCILRSRLGGGYEEIINFLKKRGVTPAITSTIFVEILWGNFPHDEIENILNMVKDGLLQCIEAPPVSNFVDRVLEDLRYPEMRIHIQRNTRDYLIAWETIENKALLITDNILDFYVMKAYGLEFFHSRDLDAVMYG
jgi:predicted nucleic acid-binding protein